MNTQNSGGRRGTRSAGPAIEARVLTDGRWHVLTGRLAQTVMHLADAGEKGFTSGEVSRFGWARRTSDYIHSLRRVGFPIETVYEQAPDGSRIGRYRLTAPVELRKPGGHEHGR